MPLGAAAPLPPEMEGAHNSAPTPLERGGGVGQKARKKRRPGRRGRSAHGHGNAVRARAAWRVRSPASPVCGPAEDEKAPAPRPILRLKLSRPAAGLRPEAWACVDDDDEDVEDAEEEDDSGGSALGAEGVAARCDFEAAPDTGRDRWAVFVVATQ